MSHKTKISLMKIDTEKPPPPSQISIKSENADKLVNASKHFSEKI